MMMLTRIEEDENLEIESERRNRKDKEIMNRRGKILTHIFSSVTITNNNNHSFFSSSFPSFPSQYHRFIWYLTRLPTMAMS